MGLSRDSILAFLFCSAAFSRTLAQTQSSEFFESVDLDIARNSSAIVEKRLEEVAPDPAVEDLPARGPSRRGVESGKGLSPESKRNLLQLHNLYRSNVTPPAGNMAYMEWDEELARLAQAWADTCEFEHGLPEHDYPATIGQNLYLGSDPSGRLGLWMWFEEHLNYDVRTRACLPKKQCGHYIQMAWSQSDRVGCGITKCDKIRFILACHYRHQAIRGVQIYDIAKPCSKCPPKNGALCLKNLCMDWDQCDRNPFECHFAHCDLECHNCGRLDEENCLCECADGWDAPDCSRVCTNKSSKCGTKPGFPKESCFLYQHIVAEEKCRLMCDMCNPVDREVSNDTCCNGAVCEDGFVLDPQTCKCYRLCPGLMCDEDGAKIQASTLNGAVPKVSFVHLFILILRVIFMFHIQNMFSCCTFRT